jgi:hypothetical protein
MNTAKNIKVLQDEMNWLQSVIDQVIKSYFLQEGHEKDWLEIPLPDISTIDCPYAKAVKKWKLDLYDRLALALTLAPHFRPELLDIFFGKNQLYDRSFTEFGGISDRNYNGFLPTGQTLLFLITANHPELLHVVLKLLDHKSVLVKEQVIVLHETETSLPMLSGKLSLSNNWFYYFITGIMQDK